MPLQLHIALSQYLIVVFFSKKEAIYWRHISSFIESMNATKKIIIAIGMSSLAALPLLAGPIVTVQVPVPAVTVTAPVPSVTVGVPDTYAWDGYEYVGVVGSDYFYLGPGDVWLPLDAPRLARWHDWERGHADWRVHAIRNERYRNDAHGHAVPMHDSHAVQTHDIQHDTDHSYDKDHDKDHDHNP
ncbi:MAG TPA: hypothetical protein VGM58_05615 [Verrucomicrobiae bacterium]